jgi:hypothetical protein
MSRIDRFAEYPGNSQFGEIGRLASQVARAAPDDVCRPDTGGQRRSGRFVVGGRRNGINRIAENINRIAEKKPRCPVD